MYKIVFKPSARKELEKIPDPIFQKIDKAILSLKKKPRPFPQSKKLKGKEECRLRVGDYRIIYAIDENRKIISIYYVRHRKDIYR